MCSAGRRTLATNVAIRGSRGTQHHRGTTPRGRRTRRGNGPLRWAPPKPITIGATRWIPPIKFKLEFNHLSEALAAGRPDATQWGRDRSGWVGGVLWAHLRSHRRRTAPPLRQAQLSIRRPAKALNAKDCRIEYWLVGDLPYLMGHGPLTHAKVFLGSQYTDHDRRFECLNFWQPIFW